MSYNNIIAPHFPEHDPGNLPRIGPLFLLMHILGAYGNRIRCTELLHNLNVRIGGEQKQIQRMFFLERWKIKIGKMFFQRKNKLGTTLGSMEHFPVSCDA
jgi:hypothetical protein